MLSQEAYILFYAKQGTPWFSSFMETEKPSLYPTISNTSPKSVLENVDQIPTLSPSFANKHSYDSIEAINTKDDSCDVHTPVLLGAKCSSDGASHKFDTEKIFSVKEMNSKRASSEVQKYVDITPRTPPRSPSPDIYDDEPPGKILFRRCLVNVLYKMSKEDSSCSLSSILKWENCND